MVLIIGGAYSGKRNYAETRFAVDPAKWIDGSVCEFDALHTAEALYGLHHLIRRMLAAGESTKDLAATLYRLNPDLLVVCDEVGAGVVPLRAEDRVARDEIGRTCQELAALSAEVHRVCCGLGLRIK